MRMTMMVVLATVVMANGGGAGAAVLSHSTFKGKNASATFLNNEPITCADGSVGVLETSLSVTGAEFVSRSHQSRPTQTNEATLFASTFDSCTGTVIFSSGVLAGAFAPDDLTSATFTGTVPLTQFDGTSAGSVTLNLTLTGTGFISSSASTFRFTFEGPDGPVVVSGHQKGQSRPATASGSVVMNGVELIGAFQDAVLADSKSGTLQLQK
jgi:hypothetical protein